MKFQEIFTLFLKKITQRLFFVKKNECRTLQQIRPEGGKEAEKNKNMSLIFSLKNKWRAAIVSTIVIVVMLVISMLGKKNVDDLSLSFKSVYEDRLVVEQYIFKMSALLYENQLELFKLEQAEMPTLVHAEILANTKAVSAIIDQYAHTYLTQKEEEVFHAFRKLLEEISVAEREMISSQTGSLDQQKSIELLSTKYKNALTQLNDLSNIQLAVAKEMLDESDKLAAGHVVMSKLEIAILILVALFVQIIIFSARLSTQKSSVKYKMN